MKKSHKKKDIEEAKLSRELRLIREQLKYPIINGDCESVLI